MIFEDTPLNYIYLVKKGLLKIYRSYEDKELILGLIEDGDVIGELELFSDSNAVSSVEVIENTELYVFNRKQFEDIVFNNKPLLLNIFKIYNERIKQLNKQVRALSFYNVNTRLCQVLVNLSEVSDSYVIEKLNQNILADRIGATTESVSKAFKDLQKEKVVAYEPKKITILNFDKLKKYSMNTI